MFEMKAPPVLSLAVSCATLLWAADSWAQEREPLRQRTARLTCGPSLLTAETRWQVPSGSSTVWLEQTLRLQRDDTSRATVLPLEGRQRKRISAERSGLDAVVLSWACLRSKSGANYILLGYGCGSEDTEKFCGGEAEWFRLLDARGQRVDSGFTRQDKRYESLHARLGVAELMSSGVSMTSLVATE